MQYLLSLIFPILSFILQTYPRFFNKYFGVDVWTRLIEVDLVRKNHHKIPKMVKNGFIIGGNFDYPPVFPFLLSFVPEKTLEKIQGFVAPFFDSLQCLLVFFIAYQITSNLTIALTAQIIYITIPIIALENSYLTARSLGYLNFTLAFYSLLVYSVSHNSLYLFIGFIFCTLIFLTHRFAMQSLMFVTIFFSIIEYTLLYFGIFLLSGILATILTRGYYLRVLQGHWLNIYFWWINYKDRFVNQVTGESLSSGRRDFIGKINIILGSFAPLALLGTNSWLIPAFIYIYFTLAPSPILIPGFTPHILFHSTLLTKFILWVLFFYVLSVVILSVKRILCIGEGQRYLEMISVPTAILSSILFFSLLKSAYSPFAILFFAGLFFSNLLLIIFVQIKLIIKDRTRSKTSDMEKVFSYINKLPRKPSVICIPHQLTTMTIYNSKANVLVNASNLGLMGNMMDFYPVLKKSIKKIAEEFNLDYLLLRESFAKLSELKLKKRNIAYKSGDVVLVKLNG